MLGWRACSFVNARVVTPQGEARSIRFRRRVLALDEPPQAGDHVVDLDGRFVLPGLVNAHDHLELNHYGELKCRERYANAREWIDDLRPIIRSNHEVRAKSRINLRDRLFIGGLKNLLAGATTVAHHNPIYAAFGCQFPVRLVERFGWAHSLGMENAPVGAYGEPGGVVAERAAATPAHVPFIVHAAEGVDAVAAQEIHELNARDSLRPNTVLVHGVAVSLPRWQELFARGVSLVWCPQSNMFLFGQTVCMHRLVNVHEARGRIGLGTDSRVTGSRDLLSELQIASRMGVSPEHLLLMVTSWGAALLRLDDAGSIRVGAAADLTVVPAAESTAAESLLHCERGDLELVVRRGTPFVGSSSLSLAFATRGIHVRRIDIDGRQRLIQAGLARRIERCTIEEPGVRTLT